MGWRIREPPSVGTWRAIRCAPDAARGFDGLLRRAAAWRMRRRQRGGGNGRATFRRDVRSQRRSVRMDEITRDNDRVEIGTFTAPVDYSDPSKGKFQLDIARHLAMKPEERIGSLLVNPGGPGFGGTDFAVFAEHELRAVAARPLRHRRMGSARHRREHAADRLHRRLRPLLRDARRDARRRGRAPAGRRPRRGVHRRLRRQERRRSTNTSARNNSARDMDAIRAALGEATISYLGFSYGSELGATWATLFPTTVRAAVLDGAVDPTAERIRERPAAGRRLRVVVEHVPRCMQTPTRSAPSTTTATPKMRSTP